MTNLFIRYLHNFDLTSIYKIDNIHSEKIDGLLLLTVESLSKYHYYLDIISLLLLAWSFLLIVFSLYLILFVKK